MRLYLLRHARAESGGGPVPDSLRALTEEGRREAAAVGAFLAARHEPPDYVLCSSARRTVETLERVLEALPKAPAVSVTDDLYLASAWKLFELVRSVEADGISSLLVIAHNPGVAELAASLSDRGDPAAIRSVSRRFLPASLAEIELPGASFRDMRSDGGTLVSHYVA
jgi:phosphohistidine phosphatase